MADLETRGGNLDRDSVKRVRQILVDAGYDDRVIELDDTARSAKDAAEAIGTELGSIVKSLVFSIQGRLIMALVAGDHTCVPENLARALNLEGDAESADAEAVKQATGFSIGGVAPIGSTTPLPIVIDRSLKRFDTVYAAAGHPHCVFPASIPDLKHLTGGIVSYNVAVPTDD
jgi:prolyl-tRNA editing enzyme YbaK/EbsC (Cys-tRNA(Pro) deacylase)